MTESTLEVLMKFRLGIFAALAGLAVSALPVFAHHSFAAEYDSTKPVEIKGTVSKVEWTNPHARFYVDVKAKDGKVINWNFALASTTVLIRNGWARTCRPSAH